MAKSGDIPGYLRRRKRNGNYYLVFRQGGKYVWRSLGTPNREKAKATARDEYSWVKAARDQDRLAVLAARMQDRTSEIEAHRDATALAVTDAWPAYASAGNRNDIADSTLAIYQYYWDAFARWLAAEHPDTNLLREITLAIAEEYKATFRNRTGRTWNAHRAFLRSFWNVLAQKARTADNPWAGLTRRKENSKGRRALTTDELRKVCGDAEGELRLMLAFGLYLGARMGDACRMDWGNLDMRRRRVTYTPNKTANKKPDPLTIPMHPALSAILGETPAKRRTGPATPNLADLYESRGPYAVSARVQKHFEACGIATLKNGTGVRKLVDAGFHSLRHTAVSLMREAGTAQSVSQAVVGHSSQEVHQLYTHTDEGAMRRAVAALPAIVDANTGSEEAAPRMVEADPILDLVEKLPDTKPVTPVKRELLALLARQE